MKLTKYIYLKTTSPFRNFVKPENLNCWFRNETHNWNDGDGYDYTGFNECSKCGRTRNEFMIAY